MTSVSHGPVAQGLSAGAAVSSRVTDAFAAIAAADRPEVFVHLRPETDVAADHAAAVAAGGPLAGMLLAVKDNVDVAGLPTTAACPSYAYLPDRDAPAVAALRAAGAVVLGKTNLDQFATGLVGTRSPHGAVRDSRRPGHISGGSSSGSAVSVALGLADIAIGTDTAGSGRVPAGLQGVVGVKPTPGVVSTEGVVPACASYDCVSILAADLDTADRAMAVLATAVGRTPFGTDVAFAAPPSPVVAVPRSMPAMVDRWRAAFRAAVATARAAGCVVTEIDLDDFLAAARLLYDGALVAERFDAVGTFVSDADHADVDPTVRTIVAGGARFTAAELLADRRRVEDLRRSALARLVGVDALLVPTAPCHPTLAEVAADPVGVNARMGTYTNFCNLFGMAAVSVPAGTVDEGTDGVAQFGVTVLAPAHHDAVAMDVARRLVGAPSAETWVEAVADTVDVAVVGAHLRGQPLESQLTDRGARWAGPVATAPRYSLVQLDTMPPKPGLVARSTGGRTIRGERWVLSPAALGSFLAALPAPMMLGAVELDDGTSIVGFGCAHDALDDAVDLSVDHWLDRPGAAVTPR